MQPLGVTVVGGLTVNTVTTLIMVPVLYHLIFSREEKATAIRDVVVKSATIPAGNEPGLEDEHPGAGQIVEQEETGDEPN